MVSVDFKNVRDTVDIVRVNEWLGIKLSKRFMGEQMRAPCPIHDGGKRAVVVTPSINRGRFKFSDAKNSASFPSTVVVFNPLKP